MGISVLQREYHVPVNLLYKKVFLVYNVIFKVIHLMITEFFFYVMQHNLNTSGGFYSSMSWITGLKKSLINRI